MLSAPTSEANPARITDSGTFNLLDPMPPTKIGWSAAAKQWRKHVGKDAQGRPKNFWLGRDEDDARFVAAVLVQYHEGMKRQGVGHWTPATEQQAMKHVESRRAFARYSAQAMQQQLNQLAGSGVPVAMPAIPAAPAPAAPLPDSTTTTPATLPGVLADFVRHLKATKRHAVALRDIALLRSIFGTVTPELVCTSKNCNKRHQGKANPIQITSDRLEDIGPATVARFLSAKREAAQLSARTCNRFRDVLAALFKWAVEQGHTTNNPMRTVKKFREPTPEIEFLSLEQIGQQLAALESRPTIRAMVATYIYAGLRREEAIWLTPADVDLTAGVIRVRAKTIDGERWQPKTGKNRVVPVSRALRAILEEHTPGETWYFTAPEGGQWNPDNFNGALAKANKSAGLRWGCKHYRHTFASRIVAQGRSLYEVAKLMGNGLAVCERYYAALVAEDMKHVVEFGPVPA